MKPESVVQKNSCKRPECFLAGTMLGISIRICKFIDFPAFMSSIGHPSNLYGHLPDTSKGSHGEFHMAGNHVEKAM